MDIRAVSASEGGVTSCFLAKVRTVQRPGTVLFHGLTDPLDRKKFQVHNIVIVGSLG